MKLAIFQTILFALTTFAGIASSVPVSLSYDSENPSPLTSKSLSAEYLKSMEFEFANPLPSGNNGGMVSNAFSGGVSSITTGITNRNDPHTGNDLLNVSPDDNVLNVFS